MINDVDKLTAASILAGDSSLGLESIAIILKRIVSTWQALQKKDKIHHQGTKSIA